MPNPATSPTSATRPSTGLQVRSRASRVAWLGAALLAGCAGPPPDTAPVVLSTDPGRVPFVEVALPPGETSGPDPLTLAPSLYGIGEPVEGNYAEVVELLSATADQQVVLFTQTDLPDDSVRSQRHRLEFAPSGGDWQLIWAGRQVQCWPGRGHQDWASGPCL